MCTLLTRAQYLTGCTVAAAVHRFMPWQGQYTGHKVTAVPGESHVMAELWNRSYGSTRSQVMVAADSLDRATV